MPRFFTYGVHAFLQLGDSSHSAGAVVPEPPPTVKWNPTQGMTHPISTTTILSPAKPFPQPPIHFRIIIEFSPDIRPHNRLLPVGPDHLRGDVRIELKIDGIIRGWKILPQAKIWPKGTKIEFSGSRVGRTEERAFMFTPLPLGTENNQKAHVDFLPSPSASTPDTHFHTISPDEEDPTLDPHTPANIPSNTSHIQILITLGKKHNTLEKYLIFSPVLQEAFYIPPRLISHPHEESEVPIPNATRGIKRKAGTLPKIKRKEGKTSNASYEQSDVSFTTGEIEELREAEESANTDANEATEWKPIGLAGKTQKTAQMREAEFTARIHLARFWYFVVPDPALMPSKSPVLGALISLLDNPLGAKNATLTTNQTDIGEYRPQEHPKSPAGASGSGKIQDELIKDKRIDGVSPNSSIKKEDREMQSTETQFRTAHMEKVSSKSKTTGVVSRSMGSDDLMSSANLEKSRRTNISLTTEENTKDRYAQTPEKANQSNYSDQCSSGIRMRGEPTSWGIVTEKRPN